MIRLFCFELDFAGFRFFIEAEHFKSMWISDKRKELTKITTICLVRHGETEWNKTGRLQGRTDIPLNETGLKQAEACGQYLQSLNWDVMAASPLQRAKQTAEVINSFLQLPLFIIDEFIERDFGDAEGMTRKEIISAFPDRNYPNKESRSALEMRIMKGLQTIHERYEGKRVLLITHGGVINTLFEILSDGKLGKQKLKLKNASLSTIRYDNGKWNIIEFNQCSHLAHLNV